MGKVVTLGKEITMEQWKSIEGYEGIYEVSDCGNVRNILTGKTLKHRENGNGYYRIELWKNKHGKKQYIHRLVAEVFLPKPKDAIEVNHIDSNGRNNHVSNLEWVTSSGNTVHAMRKGKLIPWGNAPRRIIATEISTGESIVFETISEAERTIGSRHITDVLKGKRQKAKGYVFSYAEGGDAQ